MAVTKSMEARVVDCLNGFVEISGDGKSITIHSSSNPRMPISIDLTSGQSRAIAQALRESVDSDGWSVWRQGDDGNAFVIESGLSRDAADEMVRNLELKKHKQLYFSSQKLHSHE